MAVDWEAILREQPMLKVIPAALREAAQLYPFTAGEEHCASAICLQCRQRTVRRAC